MARTVDSIIQKLTEWVASEKSLPPEQWLECATYLTVLSLPETTRLAFLEQRLAIMETELIKSGSSVAESKTVTKSTQEWLEWSEQNAKVKMIDKLILLAKKYASCVIQQGG